MVVFRVGFQVRCELVYLSGQKPYLYFRRTRVLLVNLRFLDNINFFFLVSIAGKNSIKPLFLQHQHRKSPLQGDFLRFSVAHGALGGFSLLFHTAFHFHLFIYRQFFA